MAKASRAGDAHANTPELKNGCVLRVLEAWREEPRDAPRIGSSTGVAGEKRVRIPRRKRAPWWVGVSAA